MNTAVTVVITVLVVAALILQAPRWLRVAQREHYIPWSVTRFAARWWKVTPVNTVLLVAGIWMVVLGLTPLRSVAAAWLAAITVAAPLGLSLRGRTSKLTWTRRLKTTTALLGLLDVVALAGAAVVPGRWPNVAALTLLLLQPVVLDGALAIAQPFERRAMQKFTTSATQRLRAASPTVVAITGSYGKTTTKLYARHLASSARSVLASPASFNNTGGLSRTLNEHLVPGTEVFIAEMGMYGKGEISAMCAWVRPHIGVITNIGPVHLERVGSLDGIVEAKSEIVADTPTAVLNVSAHGLAAVADRLEREGRRVIRVATEPEVPADVRVTPDGDSLVVEVGGMAHRIRATNEQPANVAAAVGISVALELPLDVVLPRLDSLPQSEHRQAVERSAAGVTVIDNTFSSNPASAAASLALLRRHITSGRRVVVVTPGMVELGPVQVEENRRFGAAISEVATDLLVVGHTNRRALLAGAGTGATTVHLMPHRDAAVAWVREHLADGDAVLYENDLPDHYP